MQRRTLLQLGFAAGLALSTGAAVVALVHPGRQAGRLTTAGRALYAGVAGAVLDGLLPIDPVEKGAVLNAHLQRLEQVIAGMPQAVQDEVDQLTTLLASAPGRRALAGLASPWDEATPQQVDASLQSMRHSALALRQQAYQALRELTNAAFFSDPAQWPAMGYAGQRPVNNIPLA